jgi:hypothetical protein
MSRSWIGLLCFFYLVAAILFAGFEAWLDPLSSSNPAFLVGHVVGGGVGLYVLAGILPTIIWAFMRFRGANAGGIFVLWAILAVVMAFFSDYGARYERNEKIANAMPNGVFSGKDRDDFIRSSKLSCAQSQKANPLTPKIGLTDAKIAAYCDCYANGMAASITVDELRTMVTTGKQPSSIVDKATALGSTCGKQVMLTK